MSQYLLSSIVLHGVVGCVLMQAVSTQRVGIQRLTAVLMALIGIALSSYLWFAYVPSTEFQFIENREWIPSMGARYQLGVDGISVHLVVLTYWVVLASVMTACLESSAVASSCALIYFTQAMAVGAFCALDGLLFYLFWESSLLPMFLYIGAFGAAKRRHAAKKYFLYTLLGSLLFLLATLYLGFQAGQFSFSAFYQLPLTLLEQQLLFIAFTAEVAIKLPMFPLHSWLPDAHTQAPTAGSMLLAAILLKLGGYGFLRYNLPITPDASLFFSPWMVILSLIAIVYIGCVAYQQTDVKRLIAYASISHMGMVTLGCFSLYLLPDAIITQIGLLGLSGVLFHMISHGFSSAGLFCAFGMLYQRVGSRSVNDFGGLMRVVPILSGFFFLFVLSNIGFPGTGGFVGEFLIIVASMSAQFWIALLAASTMLLSAIYSLVLVRRVFYGKISTSHMLALFDLSVSERTILVLLSVLIIVLGCYPALIMDKAEHSLRALTILSTYSKIGV
jgi:NADH-quinone oxidoreductase subunit M